VHGRLRQGARLPGRSLACHEVVTARDVPCRQAEGDVTMELESRERGPAAGDPSLVANLGLRWWFYCTWNQC
jgi:hypothetical protein